MRPRDFVELTLVDDLHCDLLAGENVPCQLHYGKVAAAEGLLQVVEPGDLAIVIAVSYSSIHLVSLQHHEFFVRGEWKKRHIIRHLSKITIRIN